MPFELADGDLREFRKIFRPGVIWPALREDHEAMRYWHILNESSGEVLIQHGTGAVAFLTIEGERIAGVDLRQGREAESVLREIGFRVSHEQRRRGKKFLRPGSHVDEAMAEGWPRGYALATLPPVPSGERRTRIRYRLSWGGVLEIEADHDGRVIRHCWREGGDALDILLKS
jgi:hypothetical protein